MNRETLFIQYFLGFVCLISE
jgi:IS5 family transposase